MRTLVWLILIAVFIWFGLTVRLGKFTLFQHIGRIWHSRETQDLVHGTEETAAPAVDKLKHSVHESNEHQTTTDPAH